MKTNRDREQGYILIAVMLMAALFLGMIGVYQTVTSTETATVRFSKAGTQGFYAAEAGLNLRAENIRQIFVGFNRPTGTSPTTTSPCVGGNQGSGNYACTSYSFNKRNVATYVMEDAGNPVILTIPPNERYQGLNAQEYRYTAHSTAKNSDGNTESQLELRFKSRLVPLFQFAAFFNKDLEILPGPTFQLSGPVHTNGNLFLYCNSGTLTITGQVTAAGDIYRGRKDSAVTPSCNNQPVNIYDPLSPRTLIPSCPARVLVTDADITPYNGMIQKKVQALTVPGPDVFDPTSGKVYWDKADLRVVLSLDASNNVVGVQVRTQGDAVDNPATATLTACAGVAGVPARAVGTTTIANWRERTAPATPKTMRILDVDMVGVLNCLRNSNWFGTGKQLNDTTEGGLVFHLTVKGPSSGTLPNSYGVRIRNGAQLRSTVVGAPIPVGFTVVSDQAIYVLGNYNSTNKIPAALMSDTLNVLSNNWNDANSASGIASRVATATTINAAWLAGTDGTGTEGALGGAYSGGLENFPRFHENWSNILFTYRGSIVSLGTPLHVNGLWSNQSYNPPRRDWNYDTSFNNAANLPPITPRFVYLRQELFVRDFDQ